MLGKITGRHKKKDMVKLLEKFAKTTKSEYLKDITIELGGEPEKISNLIIGKFGLIIIEDLDYQGDLYGSIDDKNWALHEVDYKTPVVNPVRQQNNQISTLRRIFPKEEIYRVEIEKFVVFLESPKKMVFYSSVKNCVYFNVFKKHLTSKEYLKDNGVNINKVKDSILKYQVD